MALEFVAGCIGGAAGVAVGHPFDTIKVRLQTQDAVNPKYRGTWHCFNQTLKSESARGLYKGMSSPMAGVSLVNAIIFGVHGNIMKKVKDPSSISANAAAGASAGFVQAFIASPMELAKTRMQIQSNGSSAVYKSPVHCLKSIIKSEGTKGVFRGQAVTVMREIPGFATYFGSYEYLVRSMTPEEEVPSSCAILVSGGLAGTFSWVSTYPIDVVKSRIQADGIEGENKYRGVWHCLRTSLANEGATFLTRGLTSTIVRSFPTNAATFSVVTYVMRAGEEIENCMDDKDTLRKLLAKGEVFVTAATSPLVNNNYEFV
ncbi:UNVERIFIED_CONTAM: hypothetical protein RMT77_019881 [Armadillidium vulgare]